MSRKLLLIAVLLPFSLLSLQAMREHGYLGIFAFHLTSSAGLQVLADLVIACLLIIVWLVGDARAQGRNPWPWVLLTLAAGSFGPLLYLLAAPRQAGDARAAMPRA